MPAIRCWNGSGLPVIPGNSLLAAVLCALLFLGSNRFQNSSDRLSTSQLFEKSGVALGAASTLLLVTAAGGAFKQVLTDSGAGNTVAELLSGVNAPPCCWAGPLPLPCASPSVLPPSQA
jgi:H+/gluconate symporter-like permease